MAQVKKKKTVKSKKKPVKTTAASKKSPPQQRQQTAKEASMEITIKAVDRSKNRLHVFKPTNALEFKKVELNNLAAGRGFTLRLIRPEYTWAQIEVIDGRRKKFLVEILDWFSTKYQCSCEDFVVEECGSCVHIAAIENIKNNQKVFASQDVRVPNWCGMLRSLATRMPYSVSQHSKNGIGFRYYDAYMGKIVSHGPIIPGQTHDTAAVTTSIKVMAAKQARQAALINASSSPPDDEGILSEITLFDYQKECFKKMLGAKRAICSMQMGAGKTAVAISCYGWLKNNVRSNPKLLVVCPKSLRGQWSDEMVRLIHQPSLQIAKPEDISKTAEHDVFITTYQFFSRHVDEFAKQKYDVVIADEIQFVRNNETKTWKALNKVQSDYFFGLSGTVIENRLGDLYSIMEIVEPYHLGPKWKFDDEFQHMISVSKSKILYKGVKNLPALHLKLKDYVFSYDQLKLPPINHTFLKTTLSSVEQSAHDLNMAEAKKLISKVLNGYGGPADRIRIQALLLKARQACNSNELLTKIHVNRPSSKIQEFLRVVTDLCVKKNEKLVVFSEWTEMLELCKRHLTNANPFIGHVTYTGAQSLKQRQEALKKFQTDPKCKIFFSSDAGGVGLDGLQLVCKNVLHLELPWNPSKLDQRTGRLHRLLQKNPVEVFYLLSNGAIEQQIEKLLVEKRTVRELTFKDLSV